jgi:hypothetical protein
MKKILSFLLSVLLLFTVVGCGKKKDVVVNSDPEAKQLYLDAVAKNAELVDSHLIMDTKMSMAMEGYGVIELFSKTEAWLRNSDSAEAEMIAISHSEVFGISVDVTAYLKDGQYYLDDGIYKYKASEIEAQAYIDNTAPASNYDFGELATNFQSTKVDGGTEITFDVSKEALAKLLSGELDDDTIAAAEFKEFSVKVFIDANGYLRAMEITVVLTATENDTTINIEMILKMEIDQLPDSYTFEFPDFSEFSESNPALY